MSRRRKDDSPRVFDVSKPHRVTPSPTARPIIVGHRPIMPDPMMSDRPLHHSTEPAKITSVPVKADDGVVVNGGSLPNSDEAVPSATPAVAALDSAGSAEPPTPGDLPESPLPTIEAASTEQPPTPPILTTPSHEVSPLHQVTVEPTEAPLPLETPTNEPPAIPPAAPLEQAAASEIGQAPKPIHSTLAATPPVPANPEAQLDQNHLAGSLATSHPASNGSKRGRRRWFIWTIVLLIVLVSYGVADAKTSLPLPFKIFRQTKAPANTTEVVQPASSGQLPEPPPIQTTPAGFTQYKLAGTTLSFAHPSSWGSPTATPELGYIQRGGLAKPTATYAYLVSFATNKDIQIAVTSAKYLPPVRTSVYYDFLQWCSPTGDSKIYKQSLHFSTSKGIDTPTTASCDQGPLIGSSKLNDTTIVQLKTKAADGKTVLGDLYTKNLTDKDLVVLRVKDAAMTNATNIKTLLGTIQVAATTP